MTATTAPTGLSSAEAAARRRASGRNELPRPAGPTWPRRIARELLTPVNAVLGAAALASAVGLESVPEAAAIMAIIIGATALAVVQEARADDAVAALDALQAPVATVFRDGALVSLPAAELVPGDLITLGPGDRVPADAELVEAHALASDEAILTGESEPVAKVAGHEAPPGAPLGDQLGAMFAGTLVTAGRGLALVTRTGASTEVGRIADQLGGRSETPLERELALLVRRLTQVSLVAGAVLAALLLARQASFGDALLAGVALAVAAIPEGLGAVGVATLALGARRLAREGAITRRLPALEALGAADVLCCDKTGTLTTGELAIGAVVADDPAALWDAVARCHDAEDGQGDPVDVVLAEGARAAGARGDARRIAVAPYDPALRQMSTVAVVDGAPVVTVKGAPEDVFARCSPSSGLERHVEAATELARSGLRVLAVASAPGRDLWGAVDPLGIVGLGDPLRPSTEAAVAACRRAGVRLVMVTGDRPDTASAIARKAGMDVAHVLAGPAAARLAGAERREALRHADVVARVDPSTKRDLVHAHQADGCVVVMTGDGVNDGPALAAADVGVALAGAGGTDVARAAADVVVTTGDLGTLVAGVREGRRVRRNLLGCLTYLLAGNAAGVAAVVGGLALLPGLRAPLLPVQLLWANLVADGVLALAFATDDPPGDHLEGRPNGRAPLMSTRNLLLTGLRGGVVGLLVLAVAALGRAQGWSQATTQAALLLNLLAARAAIAMAVRSRRHGFDRGALRSPVLKAICVSAGLQVLAFCTPWGRTALHLAPLPAAGWAMALAALLASLALASRIGLRQS